MLIGPLFVIEQSKIANINDSLSILLLIAKENPNFLLPDMHMAIKKLSVIKQARSANNIQDFEAILTNDDAIKTLSYSRDSKFWKFCKVALRAIYQYIWPDAPVTKGAELLDHVGLFNQRKAWQNQKNMATNTNVSTALNR